MSVTDAIRDISQLNPLAQVQLSQALKEIRAQGVDPLVVETLRSKERQSYLYGQGRTPAECISAGIAASYSHPGPKVTWTLNSIHITGFAVDLIAQRSTNGKTTAIWNAKDKDNLTIQRIMTKYGFEAGANWQTSPDSPHFQIKGPKGTSYTAQNTTKDVTKMVQTLLNKKITANLTADGDWGPKTTSALKTWQSKQNIETSGTLTRTALSKLLA